MGKSDLGTAGLDQKIQNWIRKGFNPIAESNLRRSRNINTI